VLTQEQNEALMQVGVGTPMGDLLRHYWLPIAAVEELEDNPMKPVRLLGEDLVLYKDLSGHYGLVDRHCPHRRADMSYGWVEECGIRCNYHGWKFDESGACVHQPFEEIAHPDAKFKDRVKIKAYRVEPTAGLLWAYMGPDPAPLVPNWEPFTWKHGFKQIVFTEITCNWFQCAENNIDPVHFEWLHTNWSKQLKNQRGGPKPPTHLKVRFNEFDYGFQYQRQLEGMTDDDELWTIGRVNLWPNCLFTGNHFEWRVPVDDNTTLSVGWFFSRVPEEMEPFEQQKIPYWYGPLVDEKTGRWISTHVMNQDFIAWVGQGTIADRTQEHLGESDRGIIQYRRRLLEEAENIKQGEQPKAQVRDPELNRKGVPLPIVGRDRLIAGWSRQDLLDKPNSPFFPREFAWQKGQPEEIRQAYWEAMGGPIQS
jgi:5,5'-dehydrodivanillate O-demethylase